MVDQNLDAAFVIGLQDAQIAKRDARIEELEAQLAKPVNIYLVEQSVDAGYDGISTETVAIYCDESKALKHFKRACDGIAEENTDNDDFDYTLYKYRVSGSDKGELVASMDSDDKEWREDRCLFL